MGFLNEMFSPKPKANLVFPVKKTETTQEAAAKALDRLISNIRNGSKR